MVFRVNVTELEARSLTARLQNEAAAAMAANQNGMDLGVTNRIFTPSDRLQERDVMIPRKYIRRLATREEIAGLRVRMQDEARAKRVCETEVVRRGLRMCILDVEYQWYVC